MISSPHIVERDIRDFIDENFPLRDLRAELGGGDSLVDSGVIDSLGVLELVEHVQSRYGIEVPDDELLPENFDSIDAIVRFVDLKLAGRAASDAA
jgi:acyl carrier protein